MITITEPKEDCDSFCIQIPKRPSKCNDSLSVNENDNNINNSNTQKKTAEIFKTAISRFINEAELNVGSELSVEKTCKKYQIQRRRFYDVLNVFETVGCCARSSADVVRWLGLANIPKKLEEIQYSLKVNLSSTPLEDIFRSSPTVEMSSSTIGFMLCFLVMGSPALDIKQVAMFLSRSNQRYKTTLCKLYQISHILEAAGIIYRSMVPCMFMLNKKYMVIVDITDVNGIAQKCQCDYYSQYNNDIENDFDINNPMSLVNLLNDHSKETAQKQQWQKQQQQQQQMMNMNQNLGNMKRQTAILTMERRKIEFFMGHKRTECRPYYRTKIPHVLV